MKKTNVIPLDERIHFEKDEIIVSKTDLKGNIVYANDVFCRVAEMPTNAVIGKPHNIIRHPDMPRAVFKLLWQRLQSRKEIFAYVKNMSATGKYYWVIAHVSPSYDQDGQVVGYHSNRRAPSAKGIADIVPLYKDLIRIERAHADRKASLDESMAFLQATYRDIGQSYDEYIWNTGSSHV
ncbi:PAS domain-containing protein [Kordiimonas aquimaris]|uniref:PAS domain-containing protein n=1 Tax=Kordiimonas aquimaris TaxID=707591 RepID=UPI0021D1C68F|nr:PAS domain-containing protein [Kordiimonas aquimaris]